MEYSHICLLYIIIVCTIQAIWRSGMPPTMCCIYSRWTTGHRPFRHEPRPLSVATQRRPYHRYNTSHRVHLRQTRTTSSWQITTHQVRTTRIETALHRRSGDKNRNRSNPNHLRWVYKKSTVLNKSDVIPK